MGFKYTALILLLGVACLAQATFAARLLLNDDGNNQNDNNEWGWDGFKWVHNDHVGEWDGGWSWNWNGWQWVQKAQTAATAVAVCKGKANLCLTSITCNNICWADLVAAKNYYELCQIPCMASYATNSIAACVKNQQLLGITDVVAEYTGVMLYCSMHPSVATAAPTPKPTTPAPYSFAFFWG